MLQKAERDLIDTLWNVKSAPLHAELPKHTRFNRYIVECKAGIRAVKTMAQADLIDTLWNVKYLLAASAAAALGI